MVKRGICFTIPAIMCAAWLQFAIAGSGGKNSDSLKMVGEQTIDADIKMAVKQSAELAKRYYISREQARKMKGFFEELKQGPDFYVTVKEESSKMIFRYEDGKSNLAQASIEDNKGNEKDIYYFDDGMMRFYREGKITEIDGFSLSFFKDGTLQSFIEFKHGGYFGRELKWNQRGQLIKAVINDGTKGREYREHEIYRVEQALEPDIKKTVKRVVELAKKYNISREQAKKSGGFIKEEKQDSNYFLTVIDKDSKNEITLNYDDYRTRTPISEVIIDNKMGYQQIFFYYVNSGAVSSYNETKNHKLDGVMLLFFDDGRLRQFVEFKENKYLGREMKWDESGELIESIHNDGSKEFKLPE